MRFARLAGLLAATLTLAHPAAQAEEQVLNLYSARHYQTDEALYRNFTQATGIKINRIEADDAGLLARLKLEGAASPADVILLVDATRLVMAEKDGLFQPFKSELLDRRVPAQYRAAAGPQGTAWYGFSTRARLIVYNKLGVPRDQVLRYEDLADPRHKGRVCTRSGSHPYNLSLFASLEERMGAAGLESWLKGVVANMARPPKGGDTDQIKAVASGECQIALSNSYYLARVLLSKKPEDQDVAEKIGYVMPNQKDIGAHLNIAGGAIARYAKNREAAQRFLEYLASDEAQRYFADGNNEWPVVSTLRTDNPALKQLGQFKAEPIHLSLVAAHIAEVQQMLDRVGFK